MDVDLAQSPSNLRSVIKKTFSVSQILTSAAGAFAEHIYITEHDHNSDFELCFYTFSVFSQIWVPCLTFDAILVLLAIWAGIQHSRRHDPRLPMFNKPRLVDILIQGNVVYFLRFAFSCFYIYLNWISARIQRSPLATFVLFLISGIENQWLPRTLLFKAPIAISAGCRLILSVKEGVSHHLISDTNVIMTSTFAFRSDTWEEDTDIS